MSPLTIFLAKLFGLCMLLMCGVMVASPDAALAAIQSMMQSSGLVLVAGIATLVAGAAAVIGHNRWSGGALTIVVTVLSWLTFIKGFAIMAAPPHLLGAFYGAIGYPGSFRIVMGVAAIFSLWLTWAAFRAKPAT
jgi:hypothetical protein